MKFKKGDKVIMINCAEADKYGAQVWTCETDSFVSNSGYEVVFLYGYRGYFCADMLELANKQEQS